METGFLQGKGVTAGGPCQHTNTALHTQIAWAKDGCRLLVSDLHYHSKATQVHAFYATPRSVCGAPAQAGNVYQVLISVEVIV